MKSRESIGNRNIGKLLASLGLQIIKLDENETNQQTLVMKISFADEKWKQ